MKNEKRGEAEGERREARNRDASRACKAGHGIRVYYQSRGGEKMYLVQFEFMRHVN